MVEDLPAEVIEKHTDIVSRYSISSPMWSPWYVGHGKPISYLQVKKISLLMRCINWRFLLYVAFSTSALLHYQWQIQWSFLTTYGQIMQLLGQLGASLWLTMRKVWVATQIAKGGTCKMHHNPKPQKYQFTSLILIQCLKWGDVIPLLYKNKLLAFAGITTNLLHYVKCLQKVSLTPTTLMAS